MRCNAYLLGAFVDGELQGWRAWQLQRHLTHCARCQTELAQLKWLSTQLKGISPLPVRPPIHRPIGLVRPALATLVMACTVGFLMRPVANRPGRENLPPQGHLDKIVRQTAPGSVDVEPLPLVPAVAHMSTPRPRVTRQRIRHRHRLVAKAQVSMPAERVIVIATVLSPPEPVTVVLEDHDDEGGTIHIESTIPAAYVVAMQKESE